MTARGVGHDEIVRRISKSGVLQDTDNMDHIRQTAAHVRALLDEGQLPGGAWQDRLLGLAAYLPQTFFFEHDKWEVAAAEEVLPSFMQWLGTPAYQRKLMVLTKNAPELLVCL